MIEFFQSIANYIEIIVNYVISFFTNLIQLLLSIPKVFISLATVLNFLPPFIAVPMAAFIGFSVIVAVLNKWG